MSYPARAEGLVNSTSDWLKLRDLWISESCLNECVSRGWLQSTGGPNIFCVCVELAETDIPVNTRWKWRDSSFFYGVVGETWWGKDRQYNSSQDNVRSKEITCPILRICTENGPYTRRDATEKHFRTTKENQEENSKPVVFYKVHSTLYLYKRNLAASNSKFNYKKNLLRK